LLALQSVVQAEDVVVDVKLAGSCRDELEELAEVDGVAARVPDLDDPRDEDEDRGRGRALLDVHRLDLVGDLPHLHELLHDGLRPDLLLPLEGQGGMFRLHMKEEEWRSQ